MNNKKAVALSMMLGLVMVFSVIIVNQNETCEHFHGIDVPKVINLVHEVILEENKCVWGNVDKLSHCVSIDHHRTRFIDHRQSLFSDHNRPLFSDRVRSLFIDKDNSNIYIQNKIKFYSKSDTLNQQLLWLTTQGILQIGFIEFRKYLPQDDTYHLVQHNHKRYTEISYNQIKCHLCCQLLHESNNELTVVQHFCLCLVITYDISKITEISILFESFCV